MDQTNNGLLNKWTITVLLSLIVAFYFLQPFLGAIVLAAVIAFLFNPIYQRVRKVRGFKSKSLAAFTTFFISTLFLGIPLAIVLTLTVIQAAKFITNIQDQGFFSSGATPGEAIDSLVSYINTTASSIAGIPNEIVRTDQVQGFISDKLPEVIQAGTAIIVATVSSVPQFFAVAILYIFIFIAFLVHQEKIISICRALSPYPNKITNTYFKKLGATINAAVKGQFIIACVQGLLGAISLAAVGFGEYFFLALLVLIFLSFIPLGGGILTIPLGFILLLTGNIWQGLVVLLTHFVIVTNIDNFLRPKLMSKDAQLPAALILLATFAGVYHFGFVGVIYGPIIMILITTSLETYLSQNSSAKK